MIESLFKSWFVDKKKSFMIGDKLSDYKAAKKSNLDFVYTSKNINKNIKKKLLLA